MKVLVVSHPSPGHFNPTLAVVAELLTRGHEVVWLSGDAYAARIEKTGARFVPISPDALPDEKALIAVLEDKQAWGLTKLRNLVRVLFLDGLVAQVRNYQAVLEDFEADILLVDWRTYGAHALRDLTGVPYATLGITPLMTHQAEVPPWGTGWTPPRTLLGRWTNASLHGFADWVVYPPLIKTWNEERAKLGIAPVPVGTSFVESGRSNVLHLLTSTPALEFPRSHLPKSIRFIGPLIPKPADEEWTPPTWWDELLAHPREAVVHVTQGTIAHDSGKLIKPTIRALAALTDLLVVVTLTACDAATAFPADNREEMPKNVRLAEWIPHSQLLPHVGLMVTNAGFGGVLAALSCGVPLVCAGRTEDKAEVSARVMWSGAGVDLSTETPTEDAIRKAVLQVMENKKYKDAAVRVAEDFATHNGPEEAVEELEMAVLDEQLEQIAGQVAAMRAVAENMTL